MILKVTEKDTKEAVVYWLRQTKGIEVAPDDLRPLYETQWRARSTKAFRQSATWSDSSLISTRP